MKVLFVYAGFERHSEAHPELRKWVPMNEYLGSPSLGLSMMAAVTPPQIEIEYRDDRVEKADRPTDADLVAMSFFTPAATRAFELAKYFRGQGKTSVAGGIFPTAMPDECERHFDVVVVGEGERLWPKLLADFAAGAVKSRYTEDQAYPLDDVPLPKLSMYFGAERDGFRPDDYPVQITRGCPLQCQACVLPLVMRKSIREFSLPHALGQLRQLKREGKRACLTEDTSWFPGRPANHLKELFRGMIEEGLEASISYVGISMPQLLVASDEVLRLAREAGVGMFYLVGGFDPITMRAFTGVDAKALDRAHKAIARAHRVGIVPYTSFLLGNDEDDVGTVDRMLEFAAASGIEKAEFAIFTPYPGTPSWDRLNQEGRILSRDWRHYNDANVVFRPAKMTPQQLADGYLRLWREFYSDKGHWADKCQAERTIQF
ncbi:MAG: radical protein [Myxococcaceae bacterium]|nr:radical protein [Myxococcaceae bacterium]